MQRPLLVLFLVCAGCHWPASIPERWDRPAVVFLGDSLTAGQGVERSQAYPALMEERMRSAGFDFPVVNAGISGDSTENGLARLDKILRSPVAVLLVELGVNDALMHHRTPDQIRSNLARIVVRGRAAKARVVLAGMKIPLAFPEDYRRGFEEVYPSLAREYGLPLVPFLLEGVGGDPRFNQGDGIHPNAEGYRIVADVVWPVLEPVLRGAAR
jgi:acyl-CoA thioesterase-1